MFRETIVLLFRFCEVCIINWRAGESGERKMGGNGRIEK